MGWGGWGTCNHFYSQTHRKSVNSKNINPDSDYTAIHPKNNLRLGTLGLSVVSGSQNQDTCKLRWLMVDNLTPYNPCSSSPVFFSVK